MRFLGFVNNILQSIERIDFVDLISGGFRSRIQSGTLTADRIVSMPDKSGEIAVGIPLVGNVVLNSTTPTRVSLGSATVSQGNFWTAIGVDAGLSNTGGSNWLAIGAYSGRAALGSFFVSIGVNAGLSNANGNYWTAIGDQAGRSNINGQNWLAIGAYAAYSNSSGSTFVSIGVNSGFDITTGSNYVCIGDNTGRGITTGSGNTIIGANIGGLPSTLSNTVLIAPGNGIPLITSDSSGLKVGSNNSNSKLRLVSPNGTVFNVSVTDSGALVVS